eukprot:COSAG05_NODE_5337_length_1204_cov_1.466968_1_plen_368_part_01
MFFVTSAAAAALCGHSLWPAAQIQKSEILGRGCWLVAAILPQAAGGGKKKDKKQERTEHHRTTSTTMIGALPEHMLLELCTAGLGGPDLASLEATARQFRWKSSWLPADGSECGSATVAEAAAARRVMGHKDGWRVAKRMGESWKYVLWVLEHRICPLPVVAVGGYHTLIRSAEGRVFGFGWNNYGQLGTGSSGTIVPHNAKEQDGNYDAAPQELDRLQGRSVVSVSAGGSHSVALTADGSLLTWGGAGFGRLGHGPTQDGQTMVASAPRLMAGCFSPGTRVACVVAGDDHTACVTASGEVFTWGKGDSGQLGHGDTRDRHAPKRVEALAVHRVTTVSCSESLTVAVTAAGKLFVWGHLGGDIWCVPP